MLRCYREKPRNCNTRIQHNLSTVRDAPHHQHTIAQILARGGLILREIRALRRRGLLPRKGGGSASHPTSRLAGRGGGPRCCST